MAIFLLIRLRSNDFDVSGRRLTGLEFDLSWRVFFLICRRYIGILQFIRVCWIFVVLIWDKCYYDGVPLEHIDWYTTFLYNFFNVYIIDFSFHVFNMKILKQKYFCVFQKKFYSQNIWRIFVFLIALYWVGFFHSITK